MKMRVVAFAACFLTATAAIAGERENALKHIAEVVAVTQLCPKVEANSAMIGLVAMRFGIDFDRDRAELTSEVLKQIAPWKGQPADAACIAGLYLYGPNGANVPNLIKEK